MCCPHPQSPSSGSSGEPGPLAVSFCLCGGKDAHVCPESFAVRGPRAWAGPFIGVSAVRGLAVLSRRFSSPDLDRATTRSSASPVGRGPWHSPAPSESSAVCSAGSHTETLTKRKHFLQERMIVWRLSLCPTLYSSLHCAPGPLRPELTLWVTRRPRQLRSRLRPARGPQRFRLHLPENLSLRSTFGGHASSLMTQLVFSGLSSYLCWLWWQLRGGCCAQRGLGGPPGAWYVAVGTSGRCRSSGPTCSADPGGCNLACI